MLDRIKFLPCWTSLTFSQFHIEDMAATIALNAAGSVEKGSVNGAVADTLVELTPLKILIDQVSEGLAAQDPIS